VFSHRLAIMDIPFMIVVSIGLAVMIFLKPQIGRVTAGLMLTLYASYTILLYANGALAH